MTVLGCKLVWQAEDISRHSKHNLKEIAKTFDSPEKDETSVRELLSYCAFANKEMVAVAVLVLPEQFS